MNLSTPGASPGKSAIHALRPMIEVGLDAGVLAGDRAYGNSPKAEDFQIVARELGFGLLFALRQDYWGKIYEDNGFVMLEGNAYSPLIKEKTKLITATIDRYRALDDPEKIDAETYQQCLEQRSKYLVQFRTAQKSDGSVQGACPASGTNPTLNCPLREMMNTTVSDKGRTLLPVSPRHIPEKDLRGGLCNNRGGTMVLRGEHWDKHALGTSFRFGTKHWHSFYSGAAADNGISQRQTEKRHRLFSGRCKSATSSRLHRGILLLHHADHAHQSENP